MAKPKQTSSIERFISDYYRRFRSDFIGEIDRAFRPNDSNLKQWSDQIDLREKGGYTTLSQRNIAKDIIKKTMNKIKNVMEKGLRNRKPEERQIMKVTIQEQLAKLLERHNKIRKDLYEELRKYIKDIFKEQLKEEFEEDSKGGPDLDAIFPPQAFSGKKHDAACQAFVAATEKILAVNGITPCNGHNHGFCFCGWGGTRKVPA